MISKKEKKIYFALESTPASHLFPIKASSKRLSMKKEVELGERVGREREEREERPCVWMCVQVHVAWLVGAPEFLLTPLLQRWTLANMQSSELLIYFN